MHTEITVKTRPVSRSRVLTERLVLDDDEFDVRAFCNYLGHCINSGSPEESKNALERIQVLGLRTVFRSVNGTDFFEVKV